MATAAAPEQKNPPLQRHFTIIGYLTFTSSGLHKSEENRQHAHETSLRLSRFLTYLHEHVEGVCGSRVYRHALGGLSPAGRSHPPTQVLVEVTRLRVLDEIRARAGQPGELRDLLEALRERIDTCSTEIVYESSLDAD